MDSNKKVKLTGILILLGICSGIFSVAPSIDSENYLTEAAKNSNQVTLAAIAQFVLSLSCLGSTVLLYPVIKRFGSNLSVGFLSFRIVAISLSIIGTVLLLSILALSQVYVQKPVQDPFAPELLGHVLKASRDSVNHVFMIFALCSGNYLCYLLLFRSKLVPQWLSVWGIIGVFLSVGASLLFLFRKVEIITWEYLVLNVPTALHELVLGIWLIAKGFGSISFPDETEEQ